MEARAEFARGLPENVQDIHAAGGLGRTDGTGGPPQSEKIEVGIESFRASLDRTCYVMIRHM